MFGAEGPIGQGQARLEGTEPDGIGVGPDRRVVPRAPSLDAGAFPEGASVEALLRAGILVQVPERGQHTAISLRLLGEAP